MTPLVGLLHSEQKPLPHIFAVHSCLYILVPIRQKHSNSYVSFISVLLPFLLWVPKQFLTAGLITESVSYTNSAAAIWGFGFMEEIKLIMVFSPRQILCVSLTFLNPSSNISRSATNSMYCFIKVQFMPISLTGSASVKNSCRKQKHIVYSSQHSLRTV